MVLILPERFSEAEFVHQMSGEGADYREGSGIGKVGVVGPIGRQGVVGALPQAIVAIVRVAEERAVLLVDVVIDAGIELVCVVRSAVDN
jgi:hypothetical protein